MARGRNKRRANRHRLPPRRQRCQLEPRPGTSTTADILPEQPVKEEAGPNLRSNLKKTNEDGRLGNRIVDLDLLVAMINSVSGTHQKSSPHCQTINLQLHNETKIGLGSNLKFSCSTCRFVSKAYQTYRPPLGKKKGAAINMLLASALLDVSIGVEKANLLLASMDIPPPSRSHMHTLTVEASESTVKLNTFDMADKRQLVIDHNTQTGATDPNQLDVSFDCRYNATRFVSSYKPGQAASQSYGVAIENHTSYKYIVGLAIQNKLCWTGAFLKNRGYEVHCPDGHPGCTANLEYMVPHSERRMAFDVANQLYDEDNIIIRTLTTDGDTKSVLGMQDFYDHLGSAWQVSRQADPHHLGSSQIRRVWKADWSREMFPQHGTRQSRQNAVSAFAKDIKGRCSSIIQSLRDLGGGDITKTISVLPNVCAATIQCYSGNCSFCPHASLVCSGVGGEGDWWYKSKFLATHGITEPLKMTEKDKELLQSILEVRLSEQAVYSVASNTSTQKCEAFNRGVLSTLPKEINRSKTFPGKLAAKVLHLNNDVRSAVEDKVKAVTGEGLSSKPRKYLQYCANKERKRKLKQKTPEFKRKRSRTRARMEHEHTRQKSGEQPEYVKGQLDYAQDYVTKSK